MEQKLGKQWLSPLTKRHRYAHGSNKYSPLRCCSAAVSPTGESSVIVNQFSF